MKIYLKMKNFKKYLDNLAEIKKRADEYRASREAAAPAANASAAAGSFNGI